METLPPYSEPFTRELMDLLETKLAAEELSMSAAIAALDHNKNLLLVGLATTIQGDITRLYNKERKV